MLEERIAIGGQPAMGFGLGLPVYPVAPCSTWIATILRGNANDTSPVMPPGFVLTGQNDAGQGQVMIGGTYSAPVGTDFPSSFADTTGGPDWQVQSYQSTPTGATWNGAGCVGAKPPPSGGGIVIPVKGGAPAPPPASTSSSSSSMPWLIAGGVAAALGVAYLVIR